MSYSKIQNPNTGKWVNINGRTGKLVLKNYIKQTGGKNTVNTQPRAVEVQQPTPPPGLPIFNQFNQFINILETNDINHLFIEPKSEEDTIRKEEEFKRFLCEKSFSGKSIEEIIEQIRQVVANLTISTLNRDLELIDRIIQESFHEEIGIDRIEQIKNSRDDEKCGISMAIYYFILSNLLTHEPSCSSMLWRDMCNCTLWDKETLEEPGGDCANCGHKYDIFNKLEILAYNYKAFFNIPT